MRYYPRKTAPQFLPAAAMTASLIASISASLNVAFCGVRVMVTASDFWLKISATGDWIINYLTRQKKHTNKEPKDYI